MTNVVLTRCVRTFEIVGHDLMQATMLPGGTKVQVLEETQMVYNKHLEKVRKVICRGETKPRYVLSEELGQVC